MSDLINVQLMLVCTARSNKRNNLKGGSSISDQSTIMLMLERSDINLKTRNGWGNSIFTTESCKLCEEYHADPNSYWLWEDYQKLVGLIDVIE